MTDPLDLDAMLAAWRAANPEHDGDRHPFGCESCAIERLVAELRTARAERDELLYQIHVLTDSENGDVVFAEVERDVLAARMLPIEYDGGLDLWCFRVETSWDLGTERGWRIGWYSNEDGVPTSLVATTWVAEPVERLDFWSR